MSDRAVGIIPVRYGSTRFPGKPLAVILGKPMIRWVYERACQARLLDRVIIATDDERIMAAAGRFGAEARMTSPEHASGTERVAEVARDVEAGIILNIQGDEPLVRGAMLDALVEALREKKAAMATLMARVYDISLLDDSHVVKVVSDANGYALLFSRSPLPHGASDYFYQHIGIYGYRRNLLLRYNRLPASRLESVEKLEQLRALENGIRIRMIEIDRPTLSVDTPGDIIGVEKRLRTRAHE
jgi:3-deoxy-manno-octulosonate cytidylyltransferase (CMP-KDO synthetase)